MNRTLGPLALTLFLASSCGSDAGVGPSSDSGGPAGKADDVQGCLEGQNCLAFASWEVLFTNPVCMTYAYDEPVMEVDGDGPLVAKPKNVYCTQEHDGEASGSRMSSPQFRLLQWLEDVGAGDEVFLAYLSFSDQKVADALCEAEERGAEVTFVLDKMSSKAEQVQGCGGEILIRGHQGSVGFAHDKLLMINPAVPGPADDDPELLRLSFGSGNMSSGTHLHHENWHFLEVQRESFFVEAHLCLQEALIDPALTDGKTPFRSFMNECREAIEHEPEDDVIPFFIPVREDAVASTELLIELIDAADTVDIGAHRFSYSEMIDALAARLADTEREFRVRLIADDDLYWLDPLPPSNVRELGPNSFGDRDKVRELRAADDGAGRFEEKYLETNHGLFLLHHNKFLIFEGMQGRADALLTGSANLTGTGFNDNLENNYYIEVPHVVDAFKAQFALMWSGEGPLPEGLDVAPRATAPADMPIEIFAPSEPTDPVDPDPGPDPAQTCVVLAEVLYDVDGADDGREWIKLHNTCDDERSLEGMSLGWGGRDYTTAGVDLDGNIAGGGCLVVGGPQDTADLVVDLVPNLQNSGTEADGIALFNAPTEVVEADTRPIDAVIYGVNNENGLIDANGNVAQPHVADAPAGQSLQRVGMSSWTAGTPDPLACP